MKHDDPIEPSCIGEGLNPVTRQEIRERAYELWERNHRPVGMEIAFWLAAEWELKAGREAPSQEVASDGSAPPNRSTAPSD